MEEINIGDDNMITIKIPAIEVIRKLRTREGRQNFCRENSKLIIFMFRLVYPIKRTRI